MSLNVKIKIDDKITPSCQKKLKQLDAVPDDVYNFWKAHTPVRTGRARRSTILSKDTIVAAYPYAERLDDGYSPQAPDGMSKPTAAYFKRRIDAILGKK